MQQQGDQRIVTKRKKRTPQQHWSADKDECTVPGDVATQGPMARALRAGMGLPERLESSASGQDYCSSGLERLVNGGDLVNSS